MNFVIQNCTTESVGKLDARHGKSTFELLFEVIETAKGKYNYNLEDDDITFALMLIDYSINRLFDDGKGKTPAVSPTISLGGLVGSDRLDNYQRQARDILASMTGKKEIAQTRLVVEAGLIAGYVDALAAEVNDGKVTKVAALQDLEEFTATYTAQKIDPSFKQIGIQILAQGRDAIKGMLV